jgi:hypothetical protein
MLGSLFPHSMHWPGTLHCCLTRRPGSRCAPAPRSAPGRRAGMGRRRSVAARFSPHTGNMGLGGPVAAPRASKLPRPRCRIAHLGQAVRPAHPGWAARTPYHTQANRRHNAGNLLAQVIQYGAHFGDTSNADGQAPCTKQPASYLGSKSINI